VQLGDELADVTGAGYVNAGGRFVEEQDAWLVDDAGRNRELPLHSFGVPGELAARGLGQPEVGKELRRPGPALAAGDAVERGTEAEIVVPGELGIEVAFVRDYADQVLSRAGGAGNRSRRC